MQYPADSETLFADSETFPAGSKALPAGCKAFPAGSESLPASSEALLACLEALPTGFKALPAGFEALPTGSELKQKQEKQRKPPCGNAIGHRPLRGHCSLTTKLTEYFTSKKLIRWHREPLTMKRFCDC